MAVFPNLFCLMYCHRPIYKVLASVNFTHIILFPFHKKMSKTITLFINSYFNILSIIQIFPSALWNRLRYLWLGITGICLAFYGRQKRMIYRFIPLIQSRFLPCISSLVKRQWTAAPPHSFCSRPRRERPHAQGEHSPKGDGSGFRTARLLPYRPGSCSSTGSPDDNSTHSEGKREDRVRVGVFLCTVLLYVWYVCVCVYLAGYEQHGKEEECDIDAAHELWVLHKSCFGQYQFVILTTADKQCT